MKIANIIIDNPSRKVDKIFDYYIPEELEDFINKGSSVIVPFGLYNKHTEGYVIDIKNGTDFKNGKLKKVSDILDEDIIINEKLLNLAYYMKKEYLCTLSESLKVMLPPRKPFKEIINIEFLKFNEGLSKKLTNILEYIKEEKIITLENLQRNYNKNVKKIEIITLEKQNCIRITKEIEKKNNKKEEIYYSIENKTKCEELLKGSSAKKQIELVNKLLESNKQEFLLNEILEKYNGSKFVIKELLIKKILIKKYREVYRYPIKENYIYNKITLNETQRKIINNIIINYKSGKNLNLIHGVTGSGKTEIYLNLVEKFISKNCGSIIMVPEIALTPQTIERFRGRFGNNVAVVHSKLSDGERYDQYRKIKRGEYKIVVGARSAIFSPVKNLKLIIIDEEQENSYKSETNPRYLTNTIAEFRAKEEKACLILGSATPSIETYYKAKRGVYNLEKINNRIDNIPMPEISIVDMKKELLFGNKSMFSRELYNKMKSELKENNQVILFLNRRGYSTFVSCRKCGYICECENCFVTLTYYSKENKLRCNHCNKEYVIPKICPKCKSKYIKYFGVGTEKIEKEVNSIFENSKSIRMDIDTTRSKGSYEKIYRDFKNNEKNVLIGTQMIAKGMDFENVTLVGVISADISLNVPDFRAGEKTFQILTQVSGRSGRGEKKGSVVIQTYNPENFYIKCVVNNDYETFYKKEIENRRFLNYPPFSKLLHIVFVSEDLELVQHEAEKVGNIFKLEIKNKNITMLGPSPCHILKIKNKYRWHIIFKGDILNIKDKVLDLLEKNMQNKDIRYMIDIDPYTLT